MSPKRVQQLQTDDIKEDAVHPVTGNGYSCGENAPTEPLFRSLITERMEGIRFVTRASAINEVVDSIAYYNSLRLYSTLGHISLLDVEKEQLRNAASTPCRFYSSATRHGLLYLEF